MADHLKLATELGENGMHDTAHSHAPPRPVPPRTPRGSGIVPGPVR